MRGEHLHDNDDDDDSDDGADDSADDGGDDDNDCDIFRFGTLSTFWPPQPQFCISVLSPLTGQQLLFSII